MQVSYLNEMWLI